MKYLILISALSISLNGLTQNVNPFWNNSMVKLAENSSSEGWVRLIEKNKFTATDFFVKNKDAFNLKDNDQMLLFKTEKDKLGYTHYRFQQHYKNIKVEGGEYILHSLNGNIVSANGHLAQNLEKDDVPLISENIALEKALKFIGAPKYERKTDDSFNYSTVPKGELLFAYRENNGTFSNVNYELTYKFELPSIGPNNGTLFIYINAQTGQIFKNSSLARHASCNCCNGTTTTLYNGNFNIVTKKLGIPPLKFSLYDGCRGGGINTLYQGNGVEDNNNSFVNAHDKKVGGSGHWAASKVYDYFLQKHSRNSFDGAGAAINLNTGLTGNKADGASWTGVEMEFGDNSTLASNDLVSLDVVGHEFTHGVIQYSAGLAGTGEAGALGESFSDIFGTMVEYFAQGGVGDYLIGEDFWIADGKIRDMGNPSSKNHPDFYGGTNWSTDPIAGIYENAAIQNLWFHLLSEGNDPILNPLPNNIELLGIGRTWAADIAYRNLTVYLTSLSDYSDAKNGAIWATMDLHPNPTCNWVVVETMKAWDAVGVSSTNGIAFNRRVDCQKLNTFHNAGQPFTDRAIYDLASDCPISQNNNSNVTFLAGNSITLEPGFESGSNFRAYIEGCFSYIQLREKRTNEDNDNESIPEIQISDEESEEIESFFKIFPNPSNGFITIQLNKPIEGNFEIKVYDIYGKIVKTMDNVKFSENIRVDLTLVKKGIYFISLIDTNEIHSKKVIIH